MQYQINNRYDIAVGYKALLDWQISKVDDKIQFGDVVSFGIAIQNQT